MDGIESVAWRGFLKAHAVLLKEIDAVLEADHRLPLSSYAVLQELAEAPKRRMRMRDLAESVALSRSGLSRLVDRLEREELVEREPCPATPAARTPYHTPRGASARAGAAGPSRRRPQALPGPLQRRRAEAARWLLGPAARARVDATVRGTTPRRPPAAAAQPPTAARRRHTILRRRRAVMSGRRPRPRICCGALIRLDRRRLRFHAVAYRYPFSWRWRDGTHPLGAGPRAEHDPDRDEPAVQHAVRCPVARQWVRTGCVAGCRPWTSSRPRTTSSCGLTCPDCPRTTSTSSSTTTCSRSPASARPSTRSARRGTTASSAHRASSRRSLTLPEGVDADAVKASFDRGVLEVHVPKPAAQAAQGRRSRSARSPRRSTPPPRRRPPSLTARRPGCGRRAGLAAGRVPTVFTVQTRDDRSLARTGELELAHGRVRTPAFVPLATKGAVKGLEPRDVAALGYELILGNTFHLFLAPGPELVAEGGRTAPIHALGAPDRSPTRAASRSSRWATATSPTRSRAGAGPGSGRGRSWRSRRTASAFAPTSTAASGSWGPRPRWRSRPALGIRTSRSCSTNARRFTSPASTRRGRPSARTAGSSAACAGTTTTGPAISSSTGSSRAASTRICVARRPPRSPRAAAAESPSAARSARTRSRCTRSCRGPRRSSSASLPSGRATCWASATSMT